MRRTRERLLGLAVLGLALCWMQGAAARTNLFSPDGVDPRMPVQSLEGPARIFAPVLKVKTIGPVPQPDGRVVRTRGTGFMVSPCLLVTNFHAVFGEPQEPIVSIGPRVEVSLNTATGTVSTEGDPIAWGGVASGGADDWALIRLKDCLGAREDVGWFDLDQGPEPGVMGYSLDTAGYPADRGGALSAQAGCRIHTITKRHTALNDCANRPGASGSPLFYYSGGIPSVVAIQRGQRNKADEVFPAYSSERANTAVTASQILSHKDVLTLIILDREATPVLNAMARRPPLPADPVEITTSAPSIEAASPPSPIEAGKAQETVTRAEAP